MDPIITSYQYHCLSEDLWVTDNFDIAYQKDMSKSVCYDDAYFQKYVSYENTDLSKGINASRLSMVTGRCDCILDVGVGSGEFMRMFSGRSYGFDINEVAIKKLIEAGSFIDPYKDAIPSFINGISMWDTMEHMKRPSDLLSKPEVGVHVFISMPIFQDLKKVHESKHYRPDEHYYYYTESGIRRFMDDLGYTHLETSDGETKAGRESILSFAFVRSRRN